MDVNFTEWKCDSDINETPKENFPELISKKVVLDENSVGLALSGGGSRSHALCAGYLRGLRDLKVLEKVKYISCVSGGSWASSIYTFVEDKTDKLLGKKTDPRNLTLKELKTASPGELAEVLIDFRGLKYIMSKRLTRTPPYDIWQDMIGEHILSKFGLFGKTMAVDEASKNEILMRNKSLSKDDIVVPPKGKPFLIVNAALGGPENHTSGWGHSLQFTPMYTGTPFYRNNEKMKYYDFCFMNRMKSYYYRIGSRGMSNYLFELQMRECEKNTKPSMELYVGGGFIDTFAFGAIKKGKGTGWFEKGKGPFTVENAIGASSAAFASILQNRTFLPYYNPHVNYFPLGKRSVTDGYNLTLSMFDGGLIENTGIIPLLQRGVKKIICCINTCEPLNQEFQYKKGCYGDECLLSGSHDVKYCADTQLLSLFGAVQRPTLAYNYTANHVFQKEQLDEVMEDLIKNKNAGNGAISKRMLTTVNNSYWHVKGNQQVEVLFIYNEECAGFIKNLPQDTKDTLKRKGGYFARIKEFVTGKRSFGKFPFYNTAFQNLSFLELDREEVNLSAAQAEFIINSNKSDVQEMFGIN